MKYLSSPQHVGGEEKADLPTLMVVSYTYSKLVSYKRWTQKKKGQTHDDEDYLVWLGKHEKKGIKTAGHSRAHHLRGGITVR